MRSSARSVGTGCSGEAERSTSGQAGEGTLRWGAGAEDGRRAAHGDRVPRRRRLAGGVGGVSRPVGGRAASTGAAEEAGGSLRRCSGALRRRPVGSSAGCAVDRGPCLRPGRARFWRGGRWREALERADWPRSRAPAPEGRRREARGIAVVVAGTGDGAARGAEGGGPSGRSVRSITGRQGAKGPVPVALEGTGCAGVAAPRRSAAGWGAWSVA